MDQLTAQVIEVAIRLHRQLGPGLLESVYEQVLAARLAAAGHAVSRQHPVDIEFDGIRIVGAFRIDLLVDDRLILEIKSVERITPVHAKQVLTYLRLTKQPVGLLLNFGCEALKEGIRRFVNDYSPSAPSACSARNQIDRS